MTGHINKYYKSVCERYQIGNIESSYYEPITSLLTQLGCAARDMSGERSGQRGENIDIKLWHNDEEVTEIEPFAGIEVKKVYGIDKSAREKFKTELDRYGNAILTDNLVWEFWHSGEDKASSVVQLIEQRGDRLLLIKENIELFLSCIEDFFLQDPTQIRSSNKLAEYMAKHARTIRSVIRDILKDDGKGNPLVDDRQMNRSMFKGLNGLYSRIKSDLQPAMNVRDFADMYAQTIVYGLFIARYNDKTPDSFDRYEAIKYLQEESELLKQFFMHIAGSGIINPILESVIDRLCVLYRLSDISELLGQDKHQDTIIHFYETFLTYYDPLLRKSLGVFYTPVQVVRYLVSMVDRILIEDFHMRLGLSNDEQETITVPSLRNSLSNATWAGKEEISVPRVAILDPACGTGSFGAEIIKYIKNTYYSGSREVFYKGIIQSKTGVLSRLIGFEIMMTSYVVARLKIRRTIEETLGHVSEVQLPTNIFLTNTLAPPHSSFERREQTRLFDFSDAITDEAYKADTWKTRRSIKVIIGNPPYLAASTNPYDISAYKTETDGVTDLRERKHSLNDDYVKFFRFSEQIINKNKEGVLAFVTNNSYLDNATFRGMRASLLRTFDKILIVNLHGSAIRQERTPDGGKDENIFDIMQGVSLFIGIKKTTNPSWASVYYADLWGLREEKFSSLEAGNIAFREHIPDKKTAILVPIEVRGKSEYESGLSIADVFVKYNSGLITRKDDLCIQHSMSAIEAIIKDFRHYDAESLRDKYCLGADTANWAVADAKEDIEVADGKIMKISFRPFDVRWTYFTGRSSGFMSRPCGEIMRNFTISSTSPVGKNIGMVFAKGDSTQNRFSMIFVNDSIVDNRITAAQTAGNASVAPLFLYNNISDSWAPNLAPNAIARMTENMNIKPGPVEVFDYIYGVLYDPVYRERFNEFLKRDFPRVPVINCEADKDNPDAFYVSEEMFRAYVVAGERLRKLHLMQTEVPAELVIEPNTSDDMEIDSTKYKNGVLHLNANKRITGIADDVWNYRIGGYQVLDKWLKSHKGEPLTIDTFAQIENIVGLLAETIRVQEDLKRLH